MVVTEPGPSSPRIYHYSNYINLTSQFQNFLHHFSPPLV